MKSQLVRTRELLPPDIEAMYSLLCTHFEGVKQEVFDADLAKKNWVILLKDEATDTLKGFSTIVMHETENECEVLSVVYSGDTIVDPSAWSSSVLSQAWIAAVNKLRCEYPRGRLYWLLICSGYRTYRFLTTFWKEFYPRHNASTPPRIKALMEFLSRSQFGNYYDSQAGIVRFPYPQVLREGLRGIPSERQKNPHIRFFETQNPGHLQGDELVCLTEISEENLTRAGRKMWFATPKGERESEGVILSIAG